MSINILFKIFILFLYMYMWGEEDWRGVSEVTDSFGLPDMDARKPVDSLKELQTLIYHKANAPAAISQLYFILLYPSLYNTSQSQLPLPPLLPLPLPSPHPLLTHLPPFCFHSEKSRPPNDIKQTYKTRGKEPQMINMIRVVSGC